MNRQGEIRSWHILQKSDLQEAFVWEVLVLIDSYSYTPIPYLFKRDVLIPAYNLLVGKSSIQAIVHQRLLTAMSL